MSFLLMMGRKLELKREWNLKELQLTQISMQYSKATKEVADFQQYMNNAKNATSVATSTFAQQAQSAALLQAGLAGKNYNQLDQAQQAKYVAAIQAGAQAGAQAAVMAEKVANSIFDAVNNSKLRALQANESNLQLQKEALQSQVAVVKEQYQATVEGEKERVKDAAPGFGLA